MFGRLPVSFRGFRKQRNAIGAGVAPPDRTEHMIIDLFVSKDGEGWRLYSAGWVPPTLRSRLDRCGERFLLPEPNLDDLGRFMNRSCFRISSRSPRLADDDVHAPVKTGTGEVLRTV
jgi:hypothetical protein